MEERELRRIETGMAVCDIDGHKIGTVAHVYGQALAATGGAARGHLSQQEVIEVKTGFLGLGKHLYVPAGAIHDVTEGGVFLSKSRSEIDQADWQTKPSYLDERGQVRAPVPAPPGGPAPEVVRPRGMHDQATHPGGPSGTTGTARWEDVMPRYRTRWEDHYGVQGARWEAYEPRYRFAWEMANRPEYGGRSWYSVQADLREAWEARHADTPWEQAADAVRDAWEHVPAVQEGTDTGRRP